MEATIWSMLGLYRDNGKEHGNYCIVYGGYIWIMEKKMGATMMGFKNGLQRMFPHMFM